jgi:hypothetical protein
MKTLFLALTLITSSAFADTVLHQKKVTLPVTISDDTVILSNLGYSNYMVKIIVPALADVTFLNHRNPRATGPCLSTRETMETSDIIQNNPGNEKIDFQITLSKNTRLTDKNTCSVTMIERVEARVRGRQFIHEVRSPLPERNAEDCR